MERLFEHSKIDIQPLPGAPQCPGKVEVALLRLDRLHPDVSGNKWFKLKYNLEAARRQGAGTVLTFGGAWSNHIASTAAICHLLSLKSIGIIRGEEPRSWSATLSRAKGHGMELHFISREQYREKDDPAFIKQLLSTHGNPYIIPEGGNNALGLKGCGEILSICNVDGYTHICCPVGTATTLCGLISTAEASQHVVGFSALKDADYLKAAIENRLQPYRPHCLWELITDYHFGGIAKKNDVLLRFMKDFSDRYSTPLDFVYTAKMMYGITDLVKKGYFTAGSRILAIHTGGLQGNQSLRTFTDK
jgi:1-aminocyclopropane-1-carboxylate deaminase/D-cysteine desulfhydrase-like pyridoxal-dependent ACC family enzyme